MPPTEPAQPPSGDGFAFLHALLLWGPLPPPRPFAPPPPAPDGAPA